MDATTRSRARPVSTATPAAGSSTWPSASSGQHIIPQHQLSLPFKVRVGVRMGTGKAERESGGSAVTIIVAATIVLWVLIALVAIFTRSGKEKDDR
ncbi:hypothetical protein GMSM_43080 [Geomonas sp. Red276]